MKALVHLAAALALTIPVYLGLANSPLDGWFQSGAGWRAFEPVFNMLEALGIHGEGDILISIMLTASFLIALALVWIGARLFHRAAKETQH
ncbi:MULTISPECIES: hypothetical protein [Burkholderia cepacia complex]|uniref:hypothetical protein n=1 Tax=Burkholderia cepacia complex TaxID=87882 RepID=UPI000CFE4CEC|nr:MULTISPECIES: hypothetical protein [Burkholderia cepacia complex]MBR7894450.1 hypothetical protein [Burkholderia multivorans]MCL4628531.1 hypothetical protein [Burkholderia multivorans]MCO1389973.1 hypothetical protein [Burkholderia multivorans]MCO7334138.1 hypothetical protein [Burkholderia multivorans]MCO7341928.1 hypothetical protein [Burkholderia multivorans]